ncbi:MAG: hypothetical protein A3G34_13740 [Candidatus Lindowbacteria bacterium RIFCSPLOWO2_12_FULL_62_27]|nr:MAG: hypothetical protein A3I06_12555 [Candidatus Lindowbacteria bacterium RIFCSPLOWO2_02_FULL_62_12]OGH62640.1 MAG: hypothetical protein A3G34_13740 [Candidatus Lindowbacteria bacterium RIFCSPLOWO2_12_FULL_62_27]
MGRESGGDLDTVASNAFYAVWVHHHLREMLGRAPVYGEDYAFDFVNYSEGLFHLVVHRGADLYLPDFPIDALVPRIRMVVISDPAAIAHLNEFSRLTTELRRWMTDYVGVLPRDIVSISNEIFLNTAKMVEHQEPEALRAGCLVVYLFYNLAYLSVADPSKGAAELIRQTVQHAVGDEFKQLKQRLLDVLEAKHKQDLMDRVMAKRYDPAVERGYLLALVRAADEDMSTKGRIDRTEELILLVVEMTACLVRGARLERALPLSEFDAKLAREMNDDLDYAGRALQRYFLELLAKADAMQPFGDEGSGVAFENLKTCLRSLAEIAAEIRTPDLPPAREGLVPIRLMLMYEATGIAVSNIEIIVRRLAGGGAFVLPDGTEHPGPEIRRVTDRDGAVEIFYRPSDPAEPYRLSATYDDLSCVYFPSDRNPNEDPAGPHIEESMDFGGAPAMDRTMKVSLDLMDRQIRFLRDHDIHIAAIDDHHPYTPAILANLEEHREQGHIGHIRLSSLPRGQEQPKEDQKCGADLIYEQYVEGKPWDNPGLRKLRDIAHVQDLALERNDLAMDLSRLIGLKHRKIDIVMTLAQNVKDLESLEGIMARFGWSKEVSSFEGMLSQVIPRTEETVGHIVLGDGDTEVSRTRILVAMSPFSDPKKGEPQVNMATAKGYLLGRKGYPADYFFYCYNFDSLQMRQANPQDDRLDLSLLAQRLGTPGDGGHRGAATCRPSLNPAFPARLFSSMNELNFLQYLGWLGARISESCGLRLLDVLPPAELDLSDQQKDFLEEIVRDSHLLELARPGSDSDRIAVLAVRAPVKSQRAPVGYLQVFHHVRKRGDIHYLIYCRPGLSSIVIQNVNDPAKRLNPGRLAKDFGWPEDGGTDMVGIASGRLNKYIKPELRWLKGDDFSRLCSLFALLFDHRTDYKVKAHSRPL